MRGQANTQKTTQTPPLPQTTMPNAPHYAAQRDRLTADGWVIKQNAKSREYTYYHPVTKKRYRSLKKAVAAADAPPAAAAANATAVAHKKNQNEKPTTAFRRDLLRASGWRITRNEKHKQHSYYHPVTNKLYRSLKKAEEADVEMLFVNAARVDDTDPFVLALL